MSGWLIKARYQPHDTDSPIDKRLAVAIADRESAIEQVRSLYEDGPNWRVTALRQLSNGELKSEGIEPGQTVETTISNERPRDPNQRAKQIVDIATDKDGDQSACS